MSSVSTTSRSVPAPETIKIWHWPLFQTGWKGVFYMLVLIGVFLLIQQRTGQTGMSSLSVLAILAVSHWFWLPVRYVFSNYGIERRLFGIPQRFPWARIEGYRAMNDGILLTRSTPTSNSMRNVYVAWSGRRGEIETIVEHYVHYSSGRRHGSSSFSVRERVR